MGEPTLTELQSRLDDVNRRERQCIKQYDQSEDGSESKRAAVEAMNKLGIERAQVEEAIDRAYREMEL